MQKLLLILFINFAALSCTTENDWFGKKTSNRKNTLIVNNNSEPETLDPCLMTGNIEGRIAINIYEGLTRREPKTLRIIPGVAKSWEIKKNNTEYIFYLRTNAKWSNGKIVKADDFIKTWIRILKPATAAKYASFLYPIKNARKYNEGIISNHNLLGIRALDDFTLKINLEAPTPYFLELTSFYVTMPYPEEQFLKYKSKWTMPQNILCNGPFILKKWIMHRHIIIEKNPYYWGKKDVKLKRVIFLPVEDHGASLNLYRFGEIDVIYDYPLEMHNFLKQKKDHKSSPGWGTYYFKINTLKKPFNNILVRKALSLAINRKQIVDNLLNQGQIKALSFTPPFLKYYKPPRTEEFNPNKAKLLLKKAGYNKNNFPPVKILYNTSQSHKHIAEVIQKMWTKYLKIKVKLINQEWKVYIKSVENLDYEIARAGWIGDFLDPLTFLDLFMDKGGNNNTGWTDKFYTLFLNKAKKETNPVKRSRLYFKAEKILLNNLPIIPIYIYSFNFLVKPYVKGIYPNLRDEHPLREVYIESEK